VPPVTHPTFRNELASETVEPDMPDNAAAAAVLVKIGRPVTVRVMENMAMVTVRPTVVMGQGKAAIAMPAQVPPNPYSGTLVVECAPGLPVVPVPAIVNLLSAGLVNCSVAAAMTTVTPIRLCGGAQGDRRNGDAEGRCHPAEFRTFELSILHRFSPDVGVARMTPPFKAFGAGDQASEPVSQHDLMYKYVQI
jgi:hypothetical protein